MTHAVRESRVSHAASEGGESRIPWTSPASASRGQRTRRANAQASALSCLASASWRSCTRRLQRQRTPAGCFCQLVGALPFSPRKGKRKGKLPNTGRRGQETRLPPEVWLEVLLARSAAAGARLAFSAVLLAPAWQNREPLGWLRRASQAFGGPSAHLPGHRGRRPRLAAIFLHLCSEACCQTLSVFRHLPPIRRDGPVIHILLPAAGSRYQCDRFSAASALCFHCVADVLFEGRGGELFYVRCARALRFILYFVWCFCACLFAPKRKRQLAYLSPVTFVECYIQPLFFLARFKLNG